MARKNTPPEEKKPAPITDQPITYTLESNFMPYAMSVIVSRAIPEIDGFKPSHRKLLYTMYNMGLLNGARTKSANIVGQTMRLNPHGDSAIYETMVRLSRGYEALIAPFIDSKGNFGKVYSRDMAYAAARYTEAKLAPICVELFKDIDHDCVDFVDNYDATMKEPALLPTTFPNILVSANLGIAVGMASSICGFNLAEVCRTAAAYIKNPQHDLMSTMPAPDFPTGGEILLDKKAMAEIYQTGRGSFRVRARWRYLKNENLIEIYEIPYTTTIEAIIDKTAELIKLGKIRDISDMRDETDLKGLKIAISLKRGADPERVMRSLFRMTPLVDSCSCNFNILIGGAPFLLGVAGILDEWKEWRCECVRRRVYYDLQKKRQRLHLLKGLSKILLDIDKAIKIIRETEAEDEVIPNLMIGFGIDNLQAEFVAEIRLRNINREYILKRVGETEALEKEIAELEKLVESKKLLYDIIVKELEETAKKYGEPRRTGIVSETEAESIEEEIEPEDYPVTVFLSKEGYLKKITPLSLRMSGEQKYKENDGPLSSAETTNNAEAIFFTDRCRAYKCRFREFEDGKASQLGDYLPAKLGMEDSESIVYMCLPGDYSGDMLFFFENGKTARVSVSAYDTKSNRRCLTGAYSDKSPLICAEFILEDCEFVLGSTDTRTLVFSSSLLAPKTTRTTIGVGVLSLKKGQRLSSVKRLNESGLLNDKRYRVRSLPAPGALLRPEDIGEQQLELRL